MIPSVFFYFLLKTLSIGSISSIIEWKLKPKKTKLKKLLLRFAQSSKKLNNTSREIQ